MDLFFKIVMAALALISAGTTAYNVFTARSFNKQVADAKKLDDTAAETRRNSQDIAHLAQRFDEYDQRNEKRLDQIAFDVAEVKKLVTDFLLENLRALARARR